MSKRLMKEREKLAKSPLDFCTSIEMVDDDILLWECKLTGPPESPYAGGTFTLRLQFPTNYPFKAPNLKFAHKVYHPSVTQDTNEICQAILGQWGPTLDVAHCLKAVYSLLQVPSAEHPLDDDIANKLVNKPKEFEKLAKKCTKDFAK